MPKNFDIFLYKFTNLNIANPFIVLYNTDGYANIRTKYKRRNT